MHESQKHAGQHIPDTEEYMLNDTIYVKLYKKDFHSGPVVKNPPSHAGDAGLIPGRGTKIPHAAGQLSPCTATTEPTRSGACAPQLERSPCTARKDPMCHN